MSQTSIPQDLNFVAVNIERIPSVPRSTQAKKSGFCSRPFVDFQQNYQENLTIT